MKKALLFAAVLICGTAAFARSPWRVPVHFAITNDAGMGYSWFVVGNHPDVGEWDFRRSVPLVWHDGHVWSADIGIQAGTELQYKFIRRATDNEGILRAPNDDDWYPAGNDNNLTFSVPAESEAPYAGKKVVFLCGWDEPVYLHYAMLASSDSESVVGEWHDALMTKTGDGRYEVEGVGEAGEWIRFVFFHPLDDKPDGEKWWYHFRPADDIEEDSFWTPLDAFCVRDGQVFNYEPAGYVSNSRFEEREIFPWPADDTEGVTNRTIRIYLPRGYDENTSRRYPVLYFADGQNIFSDRHSSADAWGVDTAADREIRAGRMREAILVGVPCRETPPPGASTDYTFAGRLWEYLPGTDVLKDPFGRLDFALPGNGFHYMNFLLGNVVPTLDCNYRTLQDPANTGHVGSSAGGLLSFWLGAWTNRFGLVGAVSGVYHKDYIPNFRSWCFEHIAELSPDKIKRIWLDTGTEETDVLGLNLYESNWDALTLLLYAGHIHNKSFHFGVYSGDYGQHNEYAWAARSTDILDFLLPVTDEFNPLLPRTVSVSENGDIVVPVYAHSTPSVVRVPSLSGDPRTDPAASTVWTLPEPAERPWATTNCTPAAAGFYWLEDK